MFHSICAGASPNLNSYADSYANANPKAYADANGYSYPNQHACPTPYYSNNSANTHSAAGGSCCAN